MSSGRGRQGCEGAAASLSWKIGDVEMSVPLPTVRTLVLEPPLEVRLVAAPLRLVAWRPVLAQAALWEYGARHVPPFVAPDSRSVPGAVLARCPALMPPSLLRDSRRGPGAPLGPRDAGARHPRAEPGRGSKHELQAGRAAGGLVAPSPDKRLTRNGCPASRSRARGLEARPGTSSRSPPRT